MNDRALSSWTNVWKKLKSERFVVRLIGFMVLKMSDTIHTTTSNPRLNNNSVRHHCIVVLFLRQDIHLPGSGPLALRFRAYDDCMGEWDCVTARRYFVKLTIWHYLGFVDRVPACRYMTHVSMTEQTTNCQQSTMMSVERSMCDSGVSRDTRSADWVQQTRCTSHVCEVNHGLSMDPNKEW